LSAKPAFPITGLRSTHQHIAKFFGNLGVAELPSCVTAIPLLNDTELWGILVAFGGRSRNRGRYRSSSRKRWLTVCSKISMEFGFKAA